MNDEMTWFGKVMDRLGRRRVILDRTSEEPYLIRFYPLFRNRNGFPYNLTIHKIMKSDEDDLHDHPWSYGTLILKGGYYEHTPEGTFWRGPGHFRWSTGESLHRLELKKDEDGNDIPCWSCFIMGKRYREWGFIRDSEWVQWQRYLGERCKTMKKYAIQIPFGRTEDGEDDWLYVTTEHPNGIPGDRLVVSYDTQEDAEDAGKIWKRFRVVEFESVTPEEKAYAENQANWDRFG